MARLVPGPRVPGGDGAENHWGWVLACAWTADGRALTAGRDGALRLWDGETLAARAEADLGWVRALAVLDGNRVACAGQDGAIRVAALGYGREILRLEGHERSVNALARSGGDILSCGDDGTVRLWRDGAEFHCMRGHDGWVTALDILTGDRAASAGFDGTVRVWDLGAGREIRAAKAHEGSVWAVAALPDGKRLATGGDDGTVRVLDAGTLKETARLDAVCPWVLALAPTSDGRFLVGGGDDQIIRLWDLETGAVADEAPAGGLVDAVAVGPDGRVVVADSNGGVVFLSLGA